MTAAAGDALPSHAPAFTPYIVNGTVTTAYPTTGALLIYDDASQSRLNSFCSGTLIGCQSFLTAAHCVCPDSADTAPACHRQGVSDPSTLRVFLQHAGGFGVTAVAIDPDYVFGQGGDLAIITLGEPVTGIAPSPINTLRQAEAGAPGTVVGFGSTASNTAVDATPASSASVNYDRSCAPAASRTRRMSAGASLGSGANTCEGDSGGPLFIDVGSGAVLAGVTSGGGVSCRAPDMPFDTAVFANAAWIAAQAGSGVSTMPCGDLPPVGDPSTTVLDTAGQLGAAQSEARWDVTVPAGTSTLRIALNGMPWSGPGGQTTNDFDLYVRAGSAPTTSQYDCADTSGTTFGFCEIIAPAAGTWSVLANRVSGSGLFQLTATTFAGPVPSVCPGDCNHDGAVTIDELLTSVGIALGTADISACPASDLNGDEMISIDELVAAVNRVLNGC